MARLTGSYTQLLRQFEAFRNAQDLEDAVRLAKEVINSKEGSHEDYPQALIVLSRAISNKYAST
jgi:hypothetical protein